MINEELKADILKSIAAHVVFDGWSRSALDMAARELNVDECVMAGLFPKGPLSAALAFHEAGDRIMLDRLAQADLEDMRFRDRVAHAVWLRLKASPDKEIVRRGMAFFALPVHTVDGAQAMWRSSDAIWTALGDRSDDVNWYTKRAILSGVLSSVVLYWLGDTSEGGANTRAFLDRRIDDVMKFEKVKAQMRENKLVQTLLSLPLAAIGRIKSPGHIPDDLPGHIHTTRQDGS